MAIYKDIEMLEKYFKRDEWNTPDERWRPESEFGAVVDAIPAADVEEVTRCKDCVHCKFDGFDDVCTYHLRHLKTTKDDYCSHGKNDCPPF